MQIPILSGIYAKATADFARSFPINLAPIAEPGDSSGTGISKGYLRLTPGLRTMTVLSGADRGGTVWNGAHYRAIGPNLVRVSSGGALTVIGAIGGSAPVTFARSFARLAVASNQQLFYYDGTALTQVADPDLGAVLSLAWQDGYFITTDGASIVMTELANPASVDPLKYGSSEADPDPVVGLLSLRGEVYALNRNSIEVFGNTGGVGFPFARQRGAQIPKGCVGPHAFSPFVETFAFCGSGRNETVSVYLAGAGQGIRISPRGLDDKLAALSEEALAKIVLESRHGAGMTELLVHLPTETWVYHWTASQQLDVPVWSILAGGADLSRPYPARHFTLADGHWWAGSSTALGVSDASEASLFGQPLAYQFDTPILYNEGVGAIIHGLELVTLGGRGPEGSVGLAYTDDGVAWSQERFASTGDVGERGKRPVWRRLGRMRHWRGFRFRGIAKGPVAFARLEAQIEPLNV